MRRRLFLILIGISFLLVLFGFQASSKSRSTRLKPASLSSGSQLQLNGHYGHPPLAFEPNRGQTDSRVQYLSHGGGYTLFLTAGEAVLVLYRPQAGFPSKFSRSKGRGRGGKFQLPSAPGPKTRTVALRMELEGAQDGVTFESRDPLPGISNYLIGNDPSKWRTHIPQYAKVQAEGVYPGIDMVYYGNQGHLEYDFFVKPGADPNLIHLKYEGAMGARVNGQGDLQLQIEGGRVTFRSPTMYQESGGQRNRVVGRYRMLEGGGVRFEVKDYDRSKPLVIDPQLDYSTYLGGNGDDAAEAIVVNGSGNAYVTGQTSSTDFPTTAGAYQTTIPSGGGPAFVTELNSTGMGVVYSTYLGGNNGDGGYGIALDGSGNAYVTGETYSTDFPTTAGAFQTSDPNTLKPHAFVAELNPTGTGLVYSTYLGGNNTDIGQAIAVEGSGDAYVTGTTYSTNFPTTTGAYQSADPNNSYTCFVAKLNPAGTGLVYSTYLGGNDTDAGQAIAVNGGGNAYVTGETYSNNFPTTAGAYQTADPTSNNTAFVTELNPAGTGILYSTYLGGEDNSIGYDIVVDGNGDAYVTGDTDCLNFPTTAGAYLTTVTSHDYYAFVTELNPTGTDLLYSTYLGGNSDNGGSAIAVDGSGDAYVTGWTEGTNFPTTPGAYQAGDPTGTATGYQHAYMTELNPTGTGLLYSSYLGGNDVDFGVGIVLDGSGNAYVTGYTQSTDFPTTAGAFQTSDPNTASYHAFVAKFDASDFGNDTGTPTSTPTDTPTPTVTNIPPTFTDTPTVSSTPTHTHTPSNTSTNTPTLSFTPTNSPTATFTPSATWTPTVTVTPTVTGTPTATGIPTATSTAGYGEEIGPPYPNPVIGPGPLQVPLRLSGTAQVSWDVFTTAFRKVAGDKQTLSGNSSLSWDLRDNWNKPVSRGLYYFRVQISGPLKATKILKIVVLR